MSLLDLVKQNDGIRLLANPVRKLSAFVKSDVAGRASDEFGDAVFLHVFGHIDADQRILLPEQYFGKSFRKFCLTYTRRSQKQERADRTFRVLQAHTASSDSLGDCRYRFILADDTLMQFLFQMKQAFSFRLRYFKHRNAGPGRNHAGDILLRNLRKVCLSGSVQFCNLILDSLLLSAELLRVLETPL